MSRFPSLSTASAREKELQRERTDFRASVSYLAHRPTGGLGQERPFTAAWRMTAPDC